MHSQLSVAGLTSANKTVKSGHTIQFQCNSPYILDGSEAIECLQSGEWSAPFPTCTGMFTLIVNTIFVYFTQLLFAFQLNQVSGNPD